MLLLLVAACAGPTASSVPAASPEPGEPAAPEPAEPGELLWEAELDLDGDGAAERVALNVEGAAFRSADRVDDDPRIPIKLAACRTADGDGPCNGTLRVGAVRHQMPLRSGYFGGLGIRAIDIDTSDGRRELLLTQRGQDSEDPPYLFTVVVYDGAELRVHELFRSSGYNSGEVKIDGSGSLTVHYDECPDAFTVSYRLEGLALTAGPVQTVRVRDPMTCAACPHVFVRESTGFVHKGAILRHMRGPRMRGLQSLSLPGAGRFVRERGRIEIEIRELEPETTYLDAVYLDVDGVRIEPERFLPTVLEPGDVVALSFRVDALPADAQVTLWAEGYYVQHH